VIAACVRCDTPIAAGAQRCEGCELRLACPACSALYLDPVEDRFCAECGDRNVQPPAPPPASDDAAPAATRATPGAGDRTRSARVKSIKLETGPTTDAGSPFRRSSREILTRLRSGHAGAASPKAAARKLPMSPAAARKVRRALRRAVPYSIAELYMKLGAALSAREDFDAAAEAFLRALEEGSEDIEVLAGLAVAAERSGAPDLALVANLERALRDPADADALARRSDRFVDDAIALTEGAWVVDEWYPQMRTLLRAGDGLGCALLTIHVCLLRADDRRALALLKEIARDVPSRGAALASELLASDRLPERLRRDNRSAHELRARVHAAVGDNALALAQVDAALDVTLPDGDPASEIPLHMLRADLLEAEQPAAAGQALIAAGRLQNLLERHPEAIEIFARATRIDPTNAQAYWYLADSRRLAAEQPVWPYGDEQAIAAAHADWLAGMAIAQPTEELAWVHLSGALITETMARASDPTGVLIWDAALEAERAVALDPGAADAWALAAAYHRTLLHPAVARVTAAAAHRRDPTGERALIEHVVASADTLASDTASLLDEAAQALPDHRSWLLAVKASDALVRGSFDAAHDACEASLSTGADESFTWPRALAAIASALAGDDATARAHADAVLALTQPGGPADAIDSRDDRGLAALVVGRPAEAAELFSSLLDTYWVDGVQARAWLACAQLMQDDANAAQREMIRFAGEVGTPLQVGFARRLLELADRMQPGRTNPSAPLHRLLDEADARLRTRSFDVDEALAELRMTGADNTSSEVRHDVARTALARIAAEAGRLDAAIAVYDELLAGGGRGAFASRQALARVLRAASASASAHEDVAGVRAAQHRLVGLGEATQIEASVAVATAALAAHALDEALNEVAGILSTATETAVLWDAYRMRGDILLAASRRDEARVAYEEALRVAATGVEPNAAFAPLQVRLALLDTNREDLASAGRRLREGIRALRCDLDLPVAAHTVISELEAVRTLTDEPLAMNCAVRALMEDHELSPAQRRLLTAARFDALRRAQPTPPTPMIRPLTLEVDDGVLGGSRDGERASVLFDALLPRMREDILETTGVRLPGLLVRPAEVLREGGYRILFNEIAYGTGTLSRNARLCLDAPQCSRLGLGGRAVVHAWSGQAGAWLDDDGAAAAADHGLALLDQLEGVVWQLGGLARVHLARFIGLTEVELRLREWEMQGGEHRCDVVGRALPHKGARVRMVSLMRRLVRAQVAVHDLEAILHGVAAEPRDATVADLADTVRARLTRSLPGVRDQRPHIAVPDDVQTAFVNAAASGSTPALDAAARSLMGCARTAGVPSAPGAFVFVCSSARARRAIQDGMDWRVPSLAVVSEDELAAAVHGAPPARRHASEAPA